MGEPEMNIRIETGGQVGSLMIVRGFHHGSFENTGSVLAFDPPDKLVYTHLSSISNLPDEAGNYTVQSFELKPAGAKTVLHISLTRFPTESILKHLEFYWRNTAPLIKLLAESAS